jgi:hypothetical protein
MEPIALSSLGSVSCQFRSSAGTHWVTSVCQTPADLTCCTCTPAGHSVTLSELWIQAQGGFQKLVTSPPFSSKSPASQVPGSAWSMRPLGTGVICLEPDPSQKALLAPVTPQTKPQERCV